MTSVLDFARHAYSLLRRDIGRKLFSFFLALVLWWLLFLFVVGEREIVLNLVRVSTVAEAEQQASSAVYLVVPENLLIRNWAPGSLEVDVKGEKDVVNGLRFRAILSLDPDTLGDQDEGEYRWKITRKTFRFEGGEEPSLIEFTPKVDEIVVSVARRGTAEISLSSANAPITGTPQEGYEVQSSLVRIYPNRVVISGPSKEVDWVVENPERLQLSPVSVEGRLGEVSQSVSLAPELVDRLLRFDSSNETLNVIVPIRPVRSQVDLSSMPVHYLNEDALLIHGMELVSTTEEIDIVIEGPRAILNRGPDWLRGRVTLWHDWTGSGDLEQATQRVRVSVTLEDAEDAASLRVMDTSGRDPEIRYELRKLRDG